MILLSSETLFHMGGQSASGFSGDLQFCKNINNTQKTEGKNKNFKK